MINFLKPNSSRPRHWGLAPWQRDGVGLWEFLGSSPGLEVTTYIHPKKKKKPSASSHNYQRHEECASLISRMGSWWIGSPFHLRI